MDKISPLTADQMIQCRRALTADDPIVSYPSAGINYVDYSITQLDSYAYNAAQHYATLLPQRSSSAQTPEVVALLGASNLDYVISILAIIKLGHTVLFLSPRISREAHVSLLERTKCRAILVNEQQRNVAQTLQQLDVPELKIHDMASANVYSVPLDPAQSTRLDRHLDPKQETKYVNWIIHSSGSTSLPRPVFLTHKALINNWKAHSFDMKAYITAPLYHSHGVGSLFKTFYTGKQAHLYNANLPMATQHLVGTLKAHRFEIVHLVPYSLKLLAESEEAIDLLAACSVVMFGGSACPDSLGDDLVSRGVNLVSHYGTTETGQLMSSERPPGDTLWNYVRPSDSTRPFLKFEDRGDGLLELICLPDWPGKVVSNRDDGSYATKDLFTKHPRLEAYKYYSRLDDTVVLVNGEKANPLIVENAVRRQEGVREAVIFGHGRDRLGLMVIPARDIPMKERAGFVAESIWPAVEASQGDMPDYAQLSSDMIKVLPADAECPMTDKRTIIRQAFYRNFASEIELAYEQADSQENQDDLVLSLPELKELIQNEVQEMISADIADRTKDFSALGMDSLHATQLRSYLMRRVNLQGHKLGLNVVFDYPTIESLASKIHSYQTNSMVTDITLDEEMTHYIEQYGTFKGVKVSPTLYASSENQCVLLTGASGSLGAHILAILLKQDNVKMIYCPVRAHTLQDGYERVLQSLRSRKVLGELEADSLLKIVILTGEQSDPRLGLDDEALHDMVSSLTAVIHCAWAVNFNLRLRSFENDCIAGTRNLIDLCLRSSKNGHRRPATFNFCSSVSTAEETREPVIKESLPPDFSYARHTGYAQSKLVTEHICFRASQATGLTTRVLRVGQLIGDMQHGIWNSNDAFPLIWQSARTIGVLPQIPETPRWLPVDVAAHTIVELSLSEEAGTDVYNVTNHRTFDWTHDLLPMLGKSPMLGTFEACHPREWVHRLRTSDPDPVKNPPYKLLEFFARRYGYDGEPRRSAFWETEKTKRYSSAFRDAPVIDQGLVDRIVKYLVDSCWSSST